MALMNRVQPRRPPSQGEPSGGFPSAQPSASQPELTAGVAPFPGQGPSSELGATSGGVDLGTLPMPPLPPMPPGSNAPIALPGFQSGGAPAPGGRSMMGAPPSGMDLFGGGGEGAGPDDELMRRILAGLPQGR